FEYSPLLHSLSPPLTFPSGRTMTTKSSMGKLEPKSDAKTETKSKIEPKSDAKSETKSKIEPKSEPKTESKSKMGKVEDKPTQKKDGKSERKKKSGTVEKTQMDQSSRAGKSQMSVMKEPPMSERKKKSGTTTGGDSKSKYEQIEARRKLAEDRGSMRVLIKKNLFVSPKKRAETDTRVCEKHGKVDRQRHLGEVLKLNLFKSANARDAALQKEADDLCECLIKANEEANKSKKEKK
ncbi:hypothetical protein PENTCL1PPCAC_23230, partial [Pristionchus entomophagus]